MSARVLLESLRTAKGGRLPALLQGDSFSHSALRTVALPPFVSRLLTRVWEPGSVAATGPYTVDLCCTSCETATGTAQGVTVRVYHDQHQITVEKRATWIHPTERRIA